MSDQYTPKDETYYTAFEFLNGTGVAVTGKVQSDFTIEVSKDGVGNQATTGITITEVDSVNNAGSYAVTISGTTGFVNTVGTYELVIFETLDDPVPARWAVTIRVTENAGSIISGVTAVSFIPTVGDGRIVDDGASPVEGAKIIFRETATGNNVTEVTTDASGLWERIYLTNSVIGYVQDPSYQQQTFSITVAAGTATGPGIDVALTSASATNKRSASYLWAYARRQMRDRTGTKADTEIKQLVNNAIEMAAKGNLWPHLLETATISIEAAYNTGTVAITKGTSTVTLTSGTFPSWAASASILISGMFYDIASRDSDTQVTIDGTFNRDTVTADSYQLHLYQYALPANLMKFGELHYGASDWIWGDQRIPWVDFQSVKSSYQTGPTATRSYVHCLAKDKLWVWPASSEDRNVLLSYYKRPADLEVGSDVADWPLRHVDVLFRAIDYQVTMLYGETASEESTRDCEKAYRNAVDGAIGNEATHLSFDPPSSGSSRSRRNGRRGHWS